MSDIFDAIAIEALAKYLHDQSRAGRVHVSWEELSVDGQVHWEHLVREYTDILEASLRERGMLRDGNVSKSKNGEWVAYEGSGNAWQDFPVTIIRKEPA
jgi:hypothetical protein